MNKTLVRPAAALLFLAGLVWAAVPAAATASAGPLEKAAGPRLIGIKIYDHDGDPGRLCAEWRSLGINTAFVSPTLAARPGFRQALRREGIGLFLILPIFYNVEALERRPDLAAITRDGSAASDDWVKFVCPSREDYRRDRVEWLKSLVRDLDPDGISLDFIRHFVFWEMVYPDRTPDSLPNTCFDGSCLRRFQDETGVVLPPGLASVPDKARWILANHLREWTDWKCGLITGMVETLAAEARTVKPGIKINIHAVPWRADDFGGAIRVVAGQDLAALSAHADFVSPMCYHHMVKRTPAWVHSVVDDMSSRVKVPLLPSIQVKEAYLPRALPAAEFREALVEALRPPSRGVVFWSWDSLRGDGERRGIVRDLCREK